MTKTLKIGSGICLVVERDPITLAKEVASVDFLVGRPRAFGIGGGWNAEEMENHGTASTRWKLLRERVLAMKEIWTKDEAEYHGEFVDFDPIWSWPEAGAEAPSAGPHRRRARRTLERVVDYCDGWMPSAGAPGTTTSRRIDELQGMAKDAGRGPIPVSVFGAAAHPETRQRFINGRRTPDFGLRSAPADEVLPVLKHYAEVIK